MADPENAYLALVDRGLLSKATVHRYLCRRRSCLIATVFVWDGLVFCAVRDYIYSPGLNAAESVEAARRKNTLDGDRHWPSHVYDVEELDRFSVGSAKAGITMDCRHYRGRVLTEDILRQVEGVRPGHADKPTRLG